MKNLNNLVNTSGNTPVNSPVNSQLVDALQDRFGLKIIARLNEQPLPHDISERLRVARQQAIARRPKSSVTASQTAPSIVLSGGAAALGGGFSGGFNDDGVSWFNRIASFLPLLALVAGLIAVSTMVDDQSANDIAAVDVQLLTDDLPPDAHTDPGFAQFLKFGPPQP